MADQAPDVSDGISFKLDKFEGPLDLLLFLIKKNEVNVYDIPISEITGQYIAYLRYLEKLDLDNVSEFHAMAATLLYIKSRTLLPVEIEADDDIDPRQELVERLIEYQKFRKLSQMMEEQEQQNEWLSGGQKLQRLLPFSDSDVWDRIEIWDLLQTFSSLMRRLPGENVIDLYEEITVNEKITLMSELLEGKGECQFADLITRRGSLMDIVCAFLAVLEAVRMKLIGIFQHRLFGDIVIRPQAAKQTA
ncbi:MAG: segregation/condensation protein A [Treponema sp.]|nr:segregation/condensation protein A [Treponema sp.]